MLGTIRGTGPWCCAASSSLGPLLVAVTLLAGACSTGDSTLRIDRAEDTVLGTVRDVAEALGLPADDDAIALTGREPCSTVSGEPGLRNRVTVRGAAPDGVDVEEVAARTLVDAGFEVVASGVPGTVLGQREGMRITAAVAARGVELDGITGCRLPAR